MALGNDFFEYGQSYSVPSVTVIRHDGHDTQIAKTVDGKHVWIWEEKDQEIADLKAKLAEVEAELALLKAQ